MSEGWDQNELDEIFGKGSGAVHGNNNEITPEELFKLIAINPRKGCVVNVELRDQDGDTVDLVKTMESILSYIKKQLSVDADIENNQFADQILPLMTQATISTVGRLLSPRDTVMALGSEVTRSAFIYSMCAAFLLLKFVQKNDLKIYTTEEPASEEEINKLHRRSRIHELTLKCRSLGINPKDAINKLHEEGHLTAQELAELMGELEDESDS